MHVIMQLCMSACMHTCTIEVCAIPCRATKLSANALCVTSWCIMIPTFDFFILCYCCCFNLFWEGILHPHIIFTCNTNFTLFRTNCSMISYNKFPIFYVMCTCHGILLLQLWIFICAYKRPLFFKRNKYMFFNHYYFFMFKSTVFY